MRKRGRARKEKETKEVSEVKADRYSRTDQVAEARAVASALGPGTLPWVGSLEPVRLVSVFASIVPSFENRQPVLLPLGFFPGSQLPASFARHPFSVFSPPIRVFLRRYLSPLPPPRSLHFFSPFPSTPLSVLPGLSTFSSPSPTTAKPSSLSCIRRPPTLFSSLLEQIDTGGKGKSFRISRFFFSPFPIFLLVSGRATIFNLAKKGKKENFFSRKIVDETMIRNRFLSIIN